MVTLPHNEDPMRQLKEAMGLHQAAVQRVANAFSAGVEKYGAVKWLGMVREAYPAMPSCYWTAIQRVAEGRLIPEAVAMEIPRLDVVARLPTVQQMKLVKDGIVVATGTDPSQKRVVYASELNPEVIKLAISDDGAVRTLDEQRAILHKRRADAAAAAAKAEAQKKRFSAAEPDETEANVEYRVVGKRIVVFKTPLHLTEVDLRKLLKELKG